MRKLTCPNCGAGLTLDDSKKRDYCFCEYCGTKISLVDHTEVHKIIDVAEIDKEATRRYQVEELMEIYKQLNSEKSIADYMYYIIGAIMIIGSMITYFVIRNDDASTICMILGALGVVCITLGSMTRDEKRANIINALYELNEKDNKDDKDESK